MAEHAAKILSGKTLSEQLEQEIRVDAAALTAAGTQPCVAVVLVGDDSASHTYVRNKIKAAQRVGIASLDKFLPAETTQDELEEVIRAFNKNPAVHGILCQLPLPKGLDAERITRLIDPAKDVDCFHPTNVGLLAMGQPHLLPGTPAGILELLTRNSIEVKGKHAVVLGRSNIVGRPMSLLLSQKGMDATVTVCHSRTPDIARYTRQADIVIAATGMPEWVTGDMVSDGVVVIDVGTNRVKDETRPSGFRLTGDVHFASVAPKASAISPVPGGVGPMTITMLLKNTLRAAQAQAAPANKDKPA